MARKCLTVPSEGRGNDGHDNEHNDLILNVDDVLSSGSRRCEPIRLHWSYRPPLLNICPTSISCELHTGPKRGSGRLQLTLCLVLTADTL